VTLADGGIDDMPIQLTPHIEARIREKVTSGLYANPEAAIDTAVQLLDEYDRRAQQLRDALAVGEEGEVLPWTSELLDQLGREAEEMQRTPDPDVWTWRITLDARIVGRDEDARGDRAIDLSG
jgi:putative addiction module CopG family antidote